MNKIPRKLKKLIKKKFEYSSCYCTYKNVLYLITCYFPKFDKLFILKSAIKEKEQIGHSRLIRAKKIGKLFTFKRTFE